MKRYIIATLLLVLALEFLIVVPLLFFTPTGQHVLSALAPTPTSTPSPVLTVRGTPPVLQASATYLLDSDTGHALVDVHGSQRLPMASTTKIMTALIALEKGNLEQSVTVQQDAVDEVSKNQGSSANLVVGDQLQLKDLLYGLLLPSGDDAAMTIADAISGSQPQFVQLMNRYAQQLHLKNTHYINADGLTYKKPDGKADPDHYTTAADLAHLAQRAMQNPLFAQIVQLQEYNLPATATHHTYSWKTTNDLLGGNVTTGLVGYPGITGIKTGYTAEAGYCLVFAGTDQKHHLIGVVLHDSDMDANQRFIDARSLLDWGFKLPVLPPPSPGVASRDSLAATDGW